MIGDSVFEVALIRGAVLALRAVTPVSFTYVAALVGATIWRQRPPPLGLLIPGCYALAECVFFLGIYWPHKRRIERLVASPPSLTQSERASLIHRCLSSIDEPEDFIRGWFHGAPLSQIKRENIREWLTWALLSQQHPEAEDTDEWKRESDSYIDAMDTAFGWSIEEGKTEGLPLMRLTIDPIHVISRPLIWYIIVGAIDAITHIGLALSGLTYYSTSTWFSTFPPRPQTLFCRNRSPRSELTYWYRPHRSATKKPIVLIHGIGIGLFAYTRLIRDIILSDPTIGLIVVEVLPISMRMTAASRPASKPEIFCADLDAILAHHSITGSFTLIGHSYGTFLAAHILHHPTLSPRISSVALLDPITFLLFHPFLVYSFVYRKPGAWRANEWMIWYFTSRDINIAGLLARGFFWSNGVLWRDDEVLKGRDVLVVLGGRDQIISTRRVWTYLIGTPLTEEEAEGDVETVEWEEEPREGGGMKVIMHTRLDHAQVLVIPDKYAPVIEHVNK